MNTPPLVSVIMPAYNAVATVDESIKSVLAQTYQNWELIIVDDASIDSTQDIAKAHTDDRIIVLCHNANQGVAAARNTGLQHAKGEYIAFLDSDDLWLESKLEKQLDFMQARNVVISYTSTAYLVEGQLSNYMLRAEPELTYRNLLKRNLMSCSSVMVRRDAMLPFPKGYMHEDLAVWLQVVKKAGCAHGLDEPLLIYRMGQATKSSNRIKSARMTLGAYRKVGYGVLVSTIFTIRYAFHSISKRVRIKQKCK